MTPAPALPHAAPAARRSSAGRRTHNRARTDRPAEPSVRVGVDLVPVGDVADSVRRYGTRYLERVFTPHEVDCCRRADARTHGRAPGYSAESLAARFAAKAATAKVLRSADSRPDWRSIEVRRAEGGLCEIHLTGHAAALAADAGIDRLEVRLTQESMAAVAIVVGRSSTGPGRGEP